MQALFQDIYEYHHHFNLKVIDQLREISADLPDKTIPLMSHIIFSHQVWNRRILDQPILSWEEKDLNKLIEIEKVNHQETLQIIERHQPDEHISYVNSKEEQFENTVRDILLHVANHTTHHRGQIIATIRQCGHAPIVTDYIFYKR